MEEIGNEKAGCISIDSQCSCSSYDRGLRKLFFDSFVSSIFSGKHIRGSFNQRCIIRRRCDKRVCIFIQHADSRCGR